MAIFARTRQTHSLCSLLLLITSLTACADPAEDAENNTSMTTPEANSTTVEMEPVPEPFSCVLQTIESRFVERPSETQTRTYIREHGVLLQLSQDTDADGEDDVVSRFFVDDADLMIELRRDSDLDGLWEERTLVSYDDRGEVSERITSTNQGLTITTSFTFDEDGLLSKEHQEIEYPSGDPYTQTISHEYDEGGRLVFKGVISSVAPDSKEGMRYAYDDSGRLSEITRVDAEGQDGPLVESFEYDEMDRVSIHRNRDMQPNTIAFTYDDKDRVIREDRDEDEEEGYEWVFERTYDERGRVIAEELFAADEANDAGERSPVSATYTMREELEECPYIEISDQPSPAPE